MILPEKMTKYLIYVLFLSIPLAFFSCYPGGIEYYNETDIILTQYDDAFDFAGNKNYFMPDSITHVVDEGQEDDIDRSYDAAILARIVTHMDAAGYTRFVDPTKPDSVVIDSANVLLTVVVTSSEYSGIGYIPGGGYWWGWYPGWGGGYYPGYPWYPGYGYGYSYSYSYSTGSMFIEMAHEDGIDPILGVIPIPWQATINGLLSGSTENTQWRVDRAIDQCFEQSQYLYN